MAASPGKCLLVTGPPGVGKTTLVMRVLESLRTSNPNLKIQGFYTREIRQGTERIGFEVVTLAGLRGPLASITNSSPESIRWPNVGRYRVNVASFESLALPELQVKGDTDLFIIDEVGKMELFSSSFFPAVLQVLESNIPVLSTVPIPKFGRDIPGVGIHRRRLLRAVEEPNSVKSPLLRSGEPRTPCALARLKNHPGAKLFTLNTSNRDAIREQIYAQRGGLLQLC